MSKKINWTDEQKKWIEENGTKYYDYELAELFNKKFNTCHPIRTISSFRQRLNVIKQKYKHDGRVNKSEKIHYATQEERRNQLENGVVSLHQLWNTRNEGGNELQNEQLEDSTYVAEEHGDSNLVQ